MQQNLIDHLDSTWSHSLRNHNTSDEMRYLGSVCVFICNSEARLNSLNPPCGTSRTRAGRKELSRPHAHTHAYNLQGSAAGKRGGDWFLLSLCCHQLSASCPGRARGSAVWRGWQNHLLPPKAASHTHTHAVSHRCTFLHHFCPLGGISTSRCRLDTEHDSRLGQRLPVDAEQSSQDCSDLD